LLINSGLTVFPRLFCTSTGCKFLCITVALHDESRLRFLTTVDFPPFNYLNQNGVLSGYHIDLVRSLCSELKVEHLCQIEARPWNELTKRLKDGKAEAIIAGLAPTAENRMEFSFSRPYMRFPARFISLQGTKPEQPFFIWLRSQHIGVIGHTVHKTMLSNYFPDVRITTFNDSTQLYAALESKLIDLAFGDGMTFSLWLANPQAGGFCQFIGGSYYGIGYLGDGMRIAVNNLSLALAMNYAIQSLERKGKLTELYMRYFPVGFY